MRLKPTDIDQDRFDHLDYPAGKPRSGRIVTYTWRSVFNFGQCKIRTFIKVSISQISDVFTCGGIAYWTPRWDFAFRLSDWYAPYRQVIINYRNSFISYLCSKCGLCNKRQLVWPSCLDNVILLQRLLCGV